VIETACDDAQGIQRTLWVIDFNGFGFKHICKQHIIKVSTERITRALCCCKCFSSWVVLVMLP